MFSKYYFYLKRNKVYFGIVSQYNDVTQFLTTIPLPYVILRPQHHLWTTPELNGQNCWLLQQLRPPLMIITLERGQRPKRARSFFLFRCIRSDILTATSKGQWVKVFTDIFNPQRQWFSTVHLGVPRNEFVTWAHHKESNLCILKVFK